MLYWNQARRGISRVRPSGQPEHGEPNLTSDHQAGQLSQVEIQAEARAATLRDGAHDDPGVATDGEDHLSTAVTRHALDVLDEGDQLLYVDVQGRPYPPAKEEEGLPREPHCKTGSLRAMISEEGGWRLATLLPVETNWLATSLR